MNAARVHRVIATPLDGDPVEFGALSLPVAPPSLNNLFINGKKGRFKSPVYKDWATRATLHLRKQSGWHVPGRVRIRLTFNCADTRVDIDNLGKPILDLLVAAGRIGDDRNVVELHSAFGAVKGTAIEIWAASKPIPAERIDQLGKAA